jgi:hypothetical protein
MTQTRTLLQNWEHKDIKFKELLDFGFQLPQYYLEGEQIYSVEEFNVNGLQAVAYGSNPPNLKIQDDIQSLIPYINQRLNISLNISDVQFEGFYQKNGTTSYQA